MIDQVAVIPPEEGTMETDTPVRNWQEWADKYSAAAAERDRYRAEADRAWTVLDWLAQNNPGALELCPYKARR